MGYSPTEVSKSRKRPSDFTFFPLEPQSPAQGLRFRRPPGGSVSGAGGTGGESPGSGEVGTPPIAGN